MQISNIQSYQNNKINTKKHNVSFKQGLPKFFIKEARKTNPDTITKELSLNGINTVNLDNNPIIAACCKKVFQIMKHYGFKLPEEILVTPMKTHDSVFFIPETNTIYINSADPKLNRLRELNKSEGKNNFLHQYIKAFCFAGHFNNLLDIHGNETKKVFRKLQQKRFSLNRKEITKAPDIVDQLVNENTELIEKDLAKSLVLRHDKKYQIPVLNSKNYTNRSLKEEDYYDACWNGIKR